jgi:hypothetical protein
MAAKQQALNEALNEALYDSRVVERHIKAGRVDRAVYDAWLSGLEDAEDDTEATETDFIATQGVKNKTDLSVEERR